MEDATREKIRHDALHNEKLLRVGKAQEQEREHIARIQTQKHEHQKLMLDLIHDATITRQRDLNQLEYEHRERILKLERRYASTDIVAEPGQSFPESENSPDCEHKGFTIGDSEGEASKKDNKAEFFTNMAKRAAERGAARNVKTVRPLLLRIRAASS